MLNVIIPLTPATYRRDHQFIARCYKPFAAKYMSRQYKKASRGQTSFFQKCFPIHLFHYFFKGRIETSLK